MTATPCPPPGALVTYLNPDVLDPAAFIHGVVIGEPVLDPETTHLWVAVLRPGRDLSVVDSANIVEVQPRVRDVW
ncbi:hypothetical protein AB0I60_00570 [Actinosynnema sp. NPDC050436]|uniref:hypothetical protein n=1 Tax=Actinosynnema sp. NPDC050436 TaxID=3155659 RepID=UPI0033C3136A